ncbi:DUF2279 domain-containing protein [Desulfopila sp. IMCC35006]|uniref:DUF2279 domain-containing protein n=1 Tax=Desulfopila sp. IMCC35006 TaxID=2569542 RepID=UPI0010ACF5EB|nr:DUF2279 domain-containing protein [Desulfopila sp. IMCC35006]TKB25729.1 DUF2279 domain-containing protein [Desulfopila sp. IMCC35006]
MKSPIRTIASLACLQAIIVGNAHGVLSAENVEPRQNLERLMTTRGCRGCDLTGLDLTRLDLSGVDVEGADMSHTKLSLTNLSSANLKNTRLIGAIFAGTDLAGADLRGADLQDTSLDNAYTADAVLDDKPMPSQPDNPPLPSAPSLHPATNVAVSGPATDVSAGNTPSDSWWSRQPKSQKMLYTNLAAATAIGIWGLATWDYGSEGFTIGHEEWFGRDTKYGGADKCGHLWSTYAFSDALTSLYTGWGYEPKKANIYAALSSWTVQFAMELGDATSETQGFSWEDMTMNTLGALTSVLMARYPELDRKIDLRVEYVINDSIKGIFDDYYNQYYSMVLKLDGFDSFENTFLKYVELSAGYYTRGFGNPDKEDTRSLFAGIGFNFSRLLNQSGWNKTAKVFEYIQVPYTVPKVSYDLD